MESSVATRRVLVVEDEMMIAMMLADMLEDLGHQVVGPVARLDKALDLAQRETIDVAVLDVNVHGQEIYPVADALIKRGIPFMLATGYGAKGVREQYRSWPILQKPFQQENLRAAIAGLKTGA